MDEETRSSAAAGQGPNTQAPPTISWGTADTVEEAPCPQATHQAGAEIVPPRQEGASDARMLGDKGPHAQLTVRRLYCTRNGGTRWQCSTTATHGQGRTCPFRHLHEPGASGNTLDNPPPGTPETEDILASIFNEVAPTADQGLQTKEHLQYDESLAAFMVSCQDGAPTTWPANSFALRLTAQNRETTSCTRDPASTSHQAHLRRNSDALRSVAATQVRKSAFSML